MVWNWKAEPRYANRSYFVRIPRASVVGDFVATYGLELG